MTPDYTAAIERGVALLDAKLGRAHWLPKLDVEGLDMGVPFAPCGCVCAQLFGKFSVGLSKLGLLDTEEDVAIAHGFEAGDDGSYVDLTAAWRAKLRVLRAEEGL